MQEGQQQGKQFLQHKKKERKILKERNLSRLCSVQH